MHTLSLHRAVSMRQRIIRMMVTRFIVCSTIQSKVVTTVPAKQTSIVWLKCQTLLSTSVWHRVYHSLANMVVCWITAHSVVLRYPVRSMPVVRPDNSCYWVLTLH